MKKNFVSVFCLCFLILSVLSPEESNGSRVITINSVRVMELFKKENKAQYGKKSEQEQKTKAAETGKKSTSDSPADPKIPAGKTAVSKTPADTTPAGKTPADTAADGSSARASEQKTPANAADTASKQPTADPSTTENTPNNTSDGTTPVGKTAETEAAGTQAEVTTEEAQKAVDEKKDEIIVFTGGVSLSVKDGSMISTVAADKVIYNRSENTIEASGNVHYSRKSGSAESGEEFTGELLLFNIDEMEGIFLDGTIKQAPRKKGDSPFTIQSATVGRDSSSTTGFKNAVLSTNADPEDDPLWSIRATRIWMLPGNELAFFNGYFSIGIVPIFYLPFFYHPADEMIFHPVFGYRNREGAFVQTTTYLLGRKPLSTDTKKSGSFSNFMKTEQLKKQERIGLFFKNLEEDDTDSSPAYIKLLADSYAQLGGLVGIEGKTIPQNTPIKQLDFSLLFGMSRTLFPPKKNLKNLDADLSYSAYDAEGKRHYNKSFLYGVSVPFRYRAHLNFGLSYAPFDFTLTMPFISDPYFKKDFFDRSEDMNWFNYLLNREKLAKGSDIGTESSHSWKINGSIKPALKPLNPWINSFNLDSASFSVDFDRKSNSKLRGAEQQYAPHREFFYPKLLKPEGKISIAGTLLSDTMLAERKSEKSLEVEGIENPFIEEKKAQAKQQAAEDTTADSIGAQEETAHTGTTAAEANPQQETDKPEKPAYIDSLLPGFKPVYGQTFDHSIHYSLSYTGDLSALQETTFATLQWKSPEDIKWKDSETRYYQLKGNAGIKGTLSYSQNLITLSSALTVAANYQRHPWTRDKKRQEVLELNNFKSNIYTLKNENTVTISPFVYTELFKPISFSWSLTEIVAKNTFTGTYQNPVWKTEKVKWDKDFITAHTGSAVFGMVFAEKYTQKLTFSTNFPPLLQAYTAALNVSFPYATVTASSRLFEKEKAKKKWFWDPFKMEVTWTFPYGIKSTQSYLYSIEDKDSERLHITFGWKTLSAFYTQSREIPQKLVQGSGWIKNGTKKKFIPFAAGFSFSNTSNPLTIYAWKNRIKIQLGLASNLQFNLIRITDSYFTFAPKIIFNIHEFWDFSFGASSRNDVIARYFQKALNLPVVIPGNTNILTDLAYSFYFWDRRKRESSGFKMQSLEIGFTHYLKDWTLKFNCDIKPQQKTERNRKYYVFTPTITFAVEWKPISDIKVKAQKKDNKFTVERGEIQ